jgi:hypothetical protein
VLARSSLQSIHAVFQDEKTAKQIVNAAKRISKKRALNDDQSEPPIKRRKAAAPGDIITPVAIEESLALPCTCATEEELKNTILWTNRAPLVLAFAVVLLKFTMPEQPLSSRLSLAQAVVSLNSRSKAVSLGLQKGNSAEEDGWGHGQPQVRIMGRNIRVMKRWGYNWRDPSQQSDEVQVQDSQETTKAEDSGPAVTESVAVGKDEPGDAPALWGLDIEAFRLSHDRQRSQATRKCASGLPIYTADSARSYLLKSFSPRYQSMTEVSPKKKPMSVTQAENERSLALLLAALDLLYASWANILSHEELDRRSWGWYVSVRPEVQHGVAGWGEKGNLKLSDILHLRRIA